MKVANHACQINQEKKDELCLGAFDMFDKDLLEDKTFEKKTTEIKKYKFGLKNCEERKLKFPVTPEDVPADYRSHVDWEKCNSLRDLYDCAAKIVS